jgi:putative transposase
VRKGIFYLLKTGCQWRRLPREFGKWNTVYSSFKCWRERGVWAKGMKALRQGERRRQGRQAEPSAGSVDRQSIKTATQTTEVGFDGGTQVTGRKRPLLVDTLGLLIAVVVTAANTDDRVGFLMLLTQDFVGGVRRLRKLWGEGGSQAEWLAQWVRDLQPTHNIDLAVTGHEGKGFQGVPWRWAVERTFAWLLHDPPSPRLRAVDHKQGSSDPTQPDSSTAETVGLMNLSTASQGSVFSPLVIQLRLPPLASWM